MKSYLLSRIKYYLSIFTVVIVISLIVNKRIPIDSIDTTFLSWIGVGFIISEIFLFINWKKDKN